MSSARPSSPRLTLAGLVTAAMAFALMQTFLIPALPTLQDDLGTSGTWITWTVSAYLLTGSVATPLIGRLGDQHGKAKLMVISLAVFLVGSVAAIFAWNVGSLIVFRRDPGRRRRGVPAVLRDHPRRVPAGAPERAMGLVSAVLGVGGGVGIVASGLIVDNLSWRWLFVVAASSSLSPSSWCGGSCPSRRSGRPRRWTSGAPSPSPARSSPCWWASPRASTSAGAPPRSSACSPPSVALFVIWGRVELRVKDPMVDMRMLARRMVLFTNLTAMLSGFALYMTWVILPTFYQLPSDLPDPLEDVADYGFGTSVTVAGLWMLPTSLSILFAGPFAGAIGRRYGGRGPLVAGMILVAIGSAGIAMFHAEPWQPALWFILCGVGIGFAFAVMPKLIVDAVRPTETGVATGMNTVVRTVGGVVGAQVGAVLLAASSGRGHRRHPGRVRLHPGLLDRRRRRGRGRHLRALRRPAVARDASPRGRRRCSPADQG